MKKIVLLASVASSAVVAFMSETCDVVLVDGPNGPVRVNKDDFDADQALEAGDRKYSLHTGKNADAAHADAQPVEPGAPMTYPDGVKPTAAPSAPDFNGPADDAGVTPLPIDPEKNAAAPVAPSANSRLVSKEGTGNKAKYFVVDGTGAKLTDDGINVDGYATDKEAWDAIMALPR